ncbi:MAG: hypothetical protein ACO23H_03215 [Alphaproteobacteria bacterium]
MADLVITPGNVQRYGNSGVYRAVQYGEAINAGEVVYQSATDQKYYKADATDATAPASTTQTAIAVSSGTAEQQGVVARQSAVIDLGAGVMTAGSVYVISSANAGGIAPEQDLATAAYLTILGYAETDDRLVLSINATGIARA